jgi:hypothetical protein
MKSNKLEYLTSLDIIRDLTPADLAQMDSQFAVLAISALFYWTWKN